MIQAAITRNKEYVIQKELPITPFIIIIGHLNNIKKIYAVFDEIKYQYENLISAVELCYKTFISLQLDYPPGSGHIWSFMQLDLYLQKDEHKAYAKDKINILSGNLNCYPTK